MVSKIRVAARNPPVPLSPGGSMVEKSGLIDTAFASSDAHGTCNKYMIGA